MMGEPFADSRDMPDLTPMIDCVFLLLVFFMVTSGLFTSQGLEVELPAPAGGGGFAQVEEINIVAGVDGTIEVSGERTTLHELAGVLRRAMEQTGLRSAVLLADRQLPHRTVIRIMDIARGEGIRSLAFASERVERED